VQKDAVIDGIRLLEKTGGKSGEYRAAEPASATDP
jgi:molybdenum cofactor biosynthesis enzyme